MIEGNHLVIGRDGSLKTDAVSGDINYYGVIVERSTKNAGDFVKLHMDTLLIRETEQ